MDPWHGLVYFILFWVALTVGAHTFNELRRRRNRTGKLQRLQAEPVEQPPQMPDGRPAAPGEAIRCVMFELVPGLKTWVVAIDIEQDVIRVRQSARRTGFRIPRFDPEKSSLIASAWRTQVTATPAAFIATAKRGIGRTMPVLIVRVPGLQPLTIGCDENIGFRWSTSASSLRFWWRGNVPWVTTPVYRTLGGDWLTLVENFGLAPYLEDKASTQPDPGAREWIASPQDLNAAAKTGRDRRGVAAWFLIILCAVGGAVFLFFGGVFSSGTPTTATIIECTGHSCLGTWNINGVSQTGEIATGLSHAPSVGSTVAIRVSFGEASTAGYWLLIFAVGGVFLAFSLLVFVSTRSRTGSLVGMP